MFGKKIMASLHGMLPTRPLTDSAAARVLLDFSNLRAGGGIQVASATLQDLTDDKLKQSYRWLENSIIRISSVLYKHISFDLSLLPGRVEIVNTSPTILALIRRPTRQFDVHFTLFGPTYTGRIARREILGFAEVTMLYRRSEYGLTGIDSDWRSCIGRFVKRRLLLNYDRYVTETSAIANRLVSRYRISASHVAIVPNRPHPALRPPLRRTSLNYRSSGELHLLYPTRAYPHKNISIIAEVGKLYAAVTKRRLVVHSTLRSEEWNLLDPLVKACMYNHGEVTPLVLANLYQAVDAVFFPSLIEASSATPLEANIAGVPLLASNRDFVLTSAEAQITFDPLSASSIVSALSSFDDNAAWHRARALRRSRNYEIELARSNRTVSYLKIIDEEVTALSTEKSEG